MGDQVALNSSLPGLDVISAGPIANDDEARPYKRLRLDESIALDVAQLLEMLVLTSLFGLSALLFHSWASYHIEQFILTSIWWLGSYALISWDRRHRSRGEPGAPMALRDALACWTKATAFTVVTVYLLKSGEEISRLWMISASIAGYASIGALNLGTLHLCVVLARKGLLGRRVAIYGCNTTTPRLIDFIDRSRGPFTRVVALFDSRPPADTPLPVESNLEGLLERVRRGQIDMVMIDLPWHAQARIDELMHELEKVDVDIMMTPVGLAHDGELPSIEFVGSRPALSLYRRPIRGSDALFKIILDKVLAAVALFVMLPLFLIVALAIKIDTPGPVFFRQKRCGFNNRPFNMLKFRSMYANMADHEGNKLCVRGDRRVTKVGAVLRRTSIDELPQLLNVLRGEMSLVGPRPHAYGAKAAERPYEEVVRRYAARHRVRPGLTGLAQIRGFRGNTLKEKDIEDRVASDLEYIRQWSLTKDLTILLGTCFTFLFQKQAY